MAFKIFLLLLFCAYYAICETDNDKCNFNTCGACIGSAHDTCVWCPNDNIKERRCMSLKEINSRKTKWCTGNFINPEPIVSNISDYDFNKTIQLKPQLMRIKVRPGTPIKFPIYFSPAEDYPLDVYYLMDISDTMTKKKKDLEQQADAIYTQLSKYTNNVRLGIGSFVEKPGFPYVDILKTQAIGKLAHSFKNHLSLTSNITVFGSTIRQISFGSNYDDPEAGLDGLMQIMTCQNELGWRNNSRRIIVLCTDSTYHSAGDGKIVGAIKPNHMQCHLENNTYTDKMALTYDYPSVSQINKVAEAENFIIVFATTKNIITEYRYLAKNIRGARHAVLEETQDAVNIIKNAYLEYATKAELHYFDKLPNYIQFTFDQDCKSNKTTNCKSTPEQRTVKIDGNLLVRYCPPDGKMKQEIIIAPIGIQDRLVIELEIDCQCDCEKQINPVTPVCHNAGFIQCGICKCNPGSYGVDCRCNGTSTTITDKLKCKFNIDDNFECSGRGTCSCGKCETCNSGYSGDFCEFDDETDCPSKNKILCSNNGRCTRGRCDCHSEWTGDDCSCTSDKSACITPYSKMECSGHGKCKCGKCECEKLKDKNGAYAGAYCETCDDCGEQLCEKLKDYVYCNVINPKNYCDQKYNTADTIVVFLNKTEINGVDWNMAQYCKMKLENDSSIIFKYKYEDGYMVLGIQNEQELPPKANLYIAVGSALGAVLLIGIITLIVWKILIDLHDKREYEKFAKESQANGFEVYENILYEPPTCTFTNPACDRL